MINSLSLTQLRLFTRKVNGDGFGATVMRAAGGAFVVRVSGALVALCTHMLLARVMGVQQYGIYAYVVSWLFILVLLSKLGLDTMMLRFVAAYRAKSEWGLLHGVIHSGTKLVLLLSVAVASLLFLTIWLLGERISSDLRLTFWISCTVLPVMALAEVQQAVLRLLGKNIYSVSP
jgi:O-antigen/teichoic acid export membrane protein